jgi:hypothetical protein
MYSYCVSFHYKHPVKFHISDISTVLINTTDRMQMLLPGRRRTVNSGLSNERPRGGTKSIVAGNWLYHYLQETYC